MNKKIDREQLYKVSLKVFGKYGFNRTRMTDISAELDLAAGTIYRYVSDKKDLYHKAVGYGLREWQVSGVRESSGYTDPLEQLIVLVLTGFQYLKKDKNLLSIMVEEPSFLSISPVDDPFYEINKDSIGIAKDILVRGVQSGRFRKIDCEYTSESFFMIYMLFIVKIFIKKEGNRTWDMVLNGFEIILQGILHRNVKEELPKRILEKHKTILSAI